MVYFNTHRFSVGVVFISSNWGSQFSKSKLFCLEEGICKNFVVLFTFWRFYGIIGLVKKDIVNYGGDTDRLYAKNKITAFF